MKKLILLIAILLIGCATPTIHPQGVIYQPTDWEGIITICAAESKVDPLNVQVRHRGTYTLPTSKQFWELTYRAADSEDDPRYKYLNPYWTGWAGVVDCRAISREFANFLIQLEPTWPIGIAENKAGAGGHVVVCCVTSDRGLVYFDQSQGLEWTGLTDFYPENIYIQNDLGWPKKCARIVDGKVIEF